jgi:hypothetical protein
MIPSSFIMICFIMTQTLSLKLIAEPVVLAKSMLNTLNFTSWTGFNRNNSVDSSKRTVLQYNKITDQLLCCTPHPPFYFNLHVSPTRIDTILPQNRTMNGFVYLIDLPQESLLVTTSSIEITRMALDHLIGYFTNCT